MPFWLLWPEKHPQQTCNLQRRDSRRYVQGVLVHHRLEAVVGGHRGQRGVVGRGDGAFMAAVVL